MAIRFVPNDPKSFDPLCPIPFRMADGYRFFGKPGDPYNYNYIKLLALNCCDCLYAGGQSLECIHCTPCLIPVIATASISVGRKKSLGNSGGSTSYSVGFDGGAAAAGTWIVLTSSANTGFLTVTGGTNAWTQLGANSDEKVYVHLATSGEPATYTITYNGSAPKDSAGISMIEVLGANATNPDVYSTANSTATSPTATGSTANSLVVVTFAAAGTGLPTQPAGYTLETSLSGGGSPEPNTAIASKPLLLPGSVSPGNWSLSGNIVSTIIFKP